MSPKKLSESTEILAAHAAYMRYMLDKPLTQYDIAKALKVNPSTVSRLLKHARDNLIKVSLNLPRITELEVRLVRQYGLADAVVFPVPWPRRKADERPFRIGLAEAAARYLESDATPIKPTYKIGISCGSTIRDLIFALTPGKFKNITISQLTVETECEVLIDRSPFSLVSQIFAKWSNQNDSSRASRAYAVQPLPGSLQERSGQWSPLYEPYRDEIFKKAEDIDVAIVGIGSCLIGKGGGTYAEILKRHGVTPAMIRHSGAMGEICNRVYDAQGEEVFGDLPGLRSFVDGVPLDLLQRLSGDSKKPRKIIAVAGGTYKVEAIRVALKNRFVNSLMTDAETAEHLCAD